MCGNLDCMPCRINLMSSCFNLPMTANEKCKYLLSVETKAETSSSVSSNMNKPSQKGKSKQLPKPKWVVKEVKAEKPENAESDDSDNISILTNSVGTNVSWVPKAT